MGKFRRSILDSTVVANGIVKENRTYMKDLDKQEALLKKRQEKNVEAEHCSTEAKAEGLDTKLSEADRLKAQKAKLQKQIDAGGKDYFATYYLTNCTKYFSVKK